LTNDRSRAADDSSFIIRPAAFPPAPDLLTLSAKTPQALRELAERYVEYLGADFASPDPNSPPPLLADVAFTAQIGREHFAHRVAVVASSADEARAALDRWLRRGSEPGCAAATVSTTDPPVVFLFSGQDCALGDMGRQLWKTAPVFREAVERCDAILGNGAQAPCQPAPAANPPSAQPALFAFQYALAELWKSWGIVPAAVVGHDVGQYAAACAAGVMSLEDALKLVAARGRLIESFPADGRMLAVMAGPDQVADVLDGLHATPLSLAIAAINSPRQTVVAGRGEAIERLATAFEKGRIRTRWLPISHAFRGAAAGPMADDFGRLCETVVFRKPRVPLISSLTGKLAGEEIAAPDYWRREPFEPIRFADAVATLDEEGYRIFVEIAPQPKLLGLGRRCMRQWAGLWLPSLKRGQSEWRVLLSSLGQLYARGLKIDWASVHRGSTRRRVMLPTYPFQRQRYWIAGGEAKADATDRPRLSTSFPPSISALENGDLERLAEELKSLETFSDEEARLLPRVLRALAKRQKRKTALT
jgi:acyl transferase domain-containing protein